MPIYMNVEGIKGEVTEDKHKEWIELNSLQFGVGRSITHAVGAGKTREASLPHVSEVVVTKMFDSSSVEFLRWSVGGAAGKKVKIDLVTVGDKSSHSYAQFEFENVLISGFSMSSGGDKPTESLSLNFTKFQLKYVPTDEAGKLAGKQPIVIYDLQTAKYS